MTEKDIFLEKGQHDYKNLQFLGWYKSEGASQKGAPKKKNTQNILSVYNSLAGLYFIRSTLKNSSLNVKWYNILDLFWIYGSISSGKQFGSMQGVSDANPKKRSSMKKILQYFFLRITTALRPDVVCGPIYEDGFCKRSKDDMPSVQ